MFEDTVGDGSGRDADREFAAALTTMLAAGPESDGSDTDGARPGAQVTDRPDAVDGPDAVDQPHAADQSGTVDQSGAAAGWDAVDRLRAADRLLSRVTALRYRRLWDVATSAGAGAGADQTGTPDPVLVGEAHQSAAAEIAAALACTTGGAERLLSRARGLIVTMPDVYAALETGEIDDARAREFLRYCNPDNGTLTETQSAVLRRRYLPHAPRWTAQLLGRRLHQAVLAIDPDAARRRYEAAIRRSGVHLCLDPDNHTATIYAEKLPPDEAAAACRRVDRLAKRAKQKGYPYRRTQAAAAIFLGLLNGLYAGLTETQIIEALLTQATDDATHATHTDGLDGAEPTASASADTTANAADHDSTDTATSPSTTTDHKSQPESQSESQSQSQSQSHEPAPTPHAGVREGVEIRVGLPTLLGHDNTPGEITGAGAITAPHARTAVTRQAHGAHWRYAIVNTNGHLQHTGRLRHRPHLDHAGRVHGGAVELHMTPDELTALAANPQQSPGWEAVIVEIAAGWADQQHAQKALDGNPAARFIRGPLAAYVRVRDTTCRFPGCLCPAVDAQLDHTREHRHGGHTVSGNAGPLCWRHHRLKDIGWTLTQPEPGRFHWRSPLGQTYHVQADPVRPNLPDPAPPAPGQDLRPPRFVYHGDNAPILWRPPGRLTRPRPVRPPRTADDDDPPPY